MNFCRFQVFDDDGKFGKDSSDEIIGTGYFTLMELGLVFS